MAAQSAQLVSHGREPAPRRRRVEVRRARVVERLAQGHGLDDVAAGNRVVVIEQESRENLGGQAYWSFGGLFLVAGEDSGDELGAPLMRALKGRGDCVFAGVGGYTYVKTQEGASALAAFSAAQNVTLTYNDQGQLVDRGETEGAAAIMGLLTNDWGYAVNTAELNPNDPVVNTASEYMYQMATIAYHTLHGTQTVVLPETVTTDAGEVFAAGTYEVPVDGRYWSAFDRTNPLDAKVREQAWTGTAHALIAELGVGSVTASTLQVGLGIAAIAAAWLRGAARPAAVSQLAAVQGA